MRSVTQTSLQNKIMILEITQDELIREPEARNLNLGRSIMVFDLKITDKTTDLNTGNKFSYQNEVYEIMNREPVQASESFLKFNCIHKGENPLNTTQESLKSVS